VKSENSPSDSGFDSEMPEVAPMTVDDPTLEDQLAAEKDRVLRLQAEIQNLRMRQARELRDQQQYGAMPVMRDILPVLDNIDRALEAANKSGESSSLLEGFQLVRQQLLTALAQHQCEPIEADGAVFDPDRHQAILQQPSADHPAGQVMMVTQTGYKLHDRVVRPAQVIVSAGPGDQAGLASKKSPGSSQQA
jgi:molecular chaperone GrpE